VLFDYLALRHVVARSSGVKTLYIEPVSPWENAYSETFLSRFLDELLKREVFADLLEAKVLVEDYREHYNHNRPHSALGYQTPAQFAEAADLDRKVEDGGKTEELESVLTLSEHLVQITGSGHLKVGSARDSD
jgi:hypothetical protein